jgi:RNA polymerase sigma-70 factor (ECF subfamily)
VHDRALIEKILLGDQKAFAILIERTEKLVTQIICKMVDNREDRKDIAQEVYMKAYKGLPSFRMEALLSTWLAKICYSSCIDYLRKKKNYSIHGLAEDLEAPEDEQLIIKERKQTLHEAIEKLGPVQRALITLYHHEELTYVQIAHITQLPVGTIKSYLFRARKSLKETILLSNNKHDI